MPFEVQRLLSLLNELDFTTRVLNDQLVENAEFFAASKVQVDKLQQLCSDTNQALEDLIASSLQA